MFIDCYEDDAIVVNYCIIHVYIVNICIYFTELGIVLRSLVRNNGITSLWRGLVPTLLRDVPFSAIYWVSYESIKSLSSSTVPSFSFSFMAGALSGAVSLTYSHCYCIF